MGKWTSIAFVWSFPGMQRTVPLLDHSSTSQRLRGQAATEHFQQVTKNCGGQSSSPMLAFSSTWTPLLSKVSLAQPIFLIQLVTQLCHTHGKVMWTGLLR